MVGEVVELADSTSIKVYLSLSGNQGDLGKCSRSLCVFFRSLKEAAVQPSTLPAHWPYSAELERAGWWRWATTTRPQRCTATTPQGQQNGSKAKHHLSAAGRRYSAMMWIMMLGLFCLSMRLLTFSDYKLRFGIIRIVFLRIVERDVIPFLVYLVIGNPNGFVFVWSKLVSLGTEGAPGGWQC